MRSLAAVAGAVLAVLATIASVASVGRAQDAPPVKQINRGTLVVHALTGEGAPIAGGVAEAWLVPAPTEATWGISRAEPTLFVYAATDVAGVAKIPVEKPAVWRVSVRAPGRATESRTVRVGLGVVRDETFHLATGFAFEGTVTDGTGAGVAGVTVYAGCVGWEADLANFLAKSTTGAAGRYRLDGLPMGPIDVWTKRPGAAMHWIARLDVPGFVRYDFSAVRGGRMTGVVRDAETGAPVASARVRAFEFGGDACVAECVSGEDGVYVLDGSAPRVTISRIVVEAPGRVLAEGDPGLPPVRAVVLATGGTYEHDLRVRSGAPADVPKPGDAPVAAALVDESSIGVGVRVRVTGADGKPVAGATVTLGEERVQRSGGIRQWPPIPRPVSAATGEDGAAVVGWSDSWREVDVTVRAPGFATGHGKVDLDATRSARDDKTPAPEASCEVKLVKGRDVVVRVVADEARTPVAGAWLTLGPDEDAGPPTISALPGADQRSDVYVGRTGADGTFRLRDVGPDAVRVHVAAAGHYAVERRIDPAAAEVVIDMNAYLSISGRFVLEDGRPGVGVTYAIFWVDHPEGWPCWFGPTGTGPNGEFRMDGARPGTYEVEAMADAGDGVPDYAPMIAGPFKAGTSGIVVQLRKGRRLRGVLAYPDGRGVADAELFIAPRLEFGVSFIRFLPTAADGSFTTDRAPQGPIYVRAIDDSGEGGRGRRVVTLGPIDPKPDEPLRIVVEEGLVIEGRLVSTDGSAMGGRPLVAVPQPAADGPPDSESVNGCVTDEDGKFRISGLAPGTYRIWYASHNWRKKVLVGGHGPGPHPIDADAGTPAGTKGLTLTWK